MNKLNKLIDKRSKWVDSSKENNFDFDSILAGLYNDPSHFIYEILQNAEDAFASEITFDLNEDYLEIIHNGKDFDFNDVDGITGIGISTKKDDLNTIGKFGVGFKSVFAITQTPIIHSGKYHFRITDFVIPTIVDNNNNDHTKIILEFNHPSRKKNEVYGTISKKLESIGLKTLLFLKNIKEIKWNTPNKSGHYYKTTNSLLNYSTVFKVSIISKVELEEQFEEYLVFTKPLEYDKGSLKVELAFRLEKDQSGVEKIIKEKNSKLVVFFPTEKVTYLNFLIQGPYKTTPNRENIPLDDEQNQFIIKETSNLVAESIFIVKEIGLLDVSFLEVLPIAKDNTDDPIYLQFYKSVKELFLAENELFPTSNKNYSSVSKTLLARGKDLTEFLNNDDLAMLFKKHFWLDTNITYDRTRELRDYLISELGIKEVDFDSFAKKIDYDFIYNKTDEWLINFYIRLLGQPSLWKNDYFNNGILRQKPIIRLSDNSHVEPFDPNDNIKVYLPSESKSDYKTVKQSVVDNKEALKFLSELGLKEPDIFAEIREFILPKYKGNNVNVIFEKYLKDIQKLLVLSQKENSTQKSELFKELKELNIIYCENWYKKTEMLCQPSEAYFPSEDLVGYFNGYESIKMISPKLISVVDETLLKNFLLSIGCSVLPRKIPTTSKLTRDEKRNIHNNNYTREISEKDYDLEGLDNFLLNITKERSSILWLFLLKSGNKHNYWSFFKGEYNWFYRTEHSSKFESKFLKTLKSEAWLFDKNENLVKPSEISFSELDDAYDRESEKIDSLKKVLDFKLDDVTVIEQQTGGKFLNKTEKEEYEVFLREKEEKQKRDNKKNEWSPNTEPEDVVPLIEELEPKIINTPDLGNQSPNDKIPSNDKPTDPQNPNKTIDNEITPKDKKRIGSWGEKLVYENLKKEYNSQKNIQIIWLNKNADSGKGYDIVIKNQDEEIKYIEVKSKTGDSKESILISGTQWEFARKLHEKNSGDKYKIYVVSRAGTVNAKINIIANPTKLWKEGKLYAHPVSFKL